MIECVEQNTFDVAYSLAMFTPRAWSRLEVQYSVPSTTTPLREVKIAVIGGMLGRLRKCLAVGTDANGLVLRLSRFLSAPKTLHIPWSHIERTKTPPLPLFAIPVESFLLGTDRILLTIPKGYVSAPTATQDPVHPR